MRVPETKPNNDGVSLNNVRLDNGYAVSCYVGCMRYGYRVLACVLIAIYVLPLLTVGIYRLTQRTILRPEVV